MGSIWLSGGRQRRRDLLPTWDIAKTDITLVPFGKYSSFKIQLLDFLRRKDFTV